MINISNYIKISIIGGFMTIFNENIKKGMWSRRRFTVIPLSRPPLCPVKRLWASVSLEVAPRIVHIMRSLVLRLFNKTCCLNKSIIYAYNKCSCMTLIKELAIRELYVLSPRQSFEFYKNAV